MFHISLYVPTEFSHRVKQSMFAAGAGKIGNYEHCAWEVEGEGQFRPLKGSKPFIGQEGLTERVREVKIEMVCGPSCIREVIAALKASHPYETPAYFVTEALSF